ncbi:gap-Pol polyprotein [Clonorchis sinensis]|uniref:Gap-Pol polyprotein n=1 Tax=Clonorchis sinensis TaxID=79923 RepID=G7Y6V1_CLOSI|nr:gap-Pol polyprotein [Clonorchis sinensis]
MRLETARMGPRWDPTMFYAIPQQPLDRALPGLEGVSRQQLLFHQFIEAAQPAPGSQLRLVTATGQLSVKRLVHLAWELTEALLATLQSNEKRDGSPVENLKNKADQLAEQLAVTNTESWRQARKIRRYRCAMPGH